MINPSSFHEGMRGSCLFMLGMTCALVATSVSPSYAADAPQAIKLAVRDNYEIEVGAELERVAIADPAIVDVLLLKPGAQRKGSVLLVGKQAGTTTVSLWIKGEARARLHVVTVLGELALLKPVPPGAAVDVRGGRAVVRGSFASVAEHEDALLAARDSVGKDGAVLDASTIASPGVVQVDVKVVEFSKSVMKQAGFNLVRSSDRGFSFGVYSPSGGYSGVIGGGGLPAAGAAVAGAFNLVFLNAARSLSVNLSLLESNGMARVLAEPSLVALSGQSASFLSGGELPVPSAGGLGTTTVDYKPFGIGLTLTPTVLGPNRIALKVAPEASDIDFSSGVTIGGLQIPGISTRRADTTVELGDGESFVIGGLVSRTTVSNLDKVPFLGDLPVIGAFFKNMTYSQQEKELVIIVTPKLVQPIARGVALPLPGDMQDRRDSPGSAWGGYVMGVASDDVLPGFSR